MGQYLTPLLHFQRFFIPTLLILLVWAIWRTVVRKDHAVGLALYIGLVVVVDAFYNTGIFIPGLAVGSIRYSEICALFLIVHRGRATEPVQLKVVFSLVVVYFGLLFISAFRADSMSAAIFDFRRIAIPQIVAFYLAYRGLKTPADLRRFFLCFTVLATVVTLFSFWDVLFDRHLLHSDMLGKPEYYHNRRVGRFGSIFLNPNFLGAFVVLVFPSIFVLALNEKVRKLRIYLMGLILMLVFALVQTQSRAAILAFAGSAVVLALGPIGAMSRTRRVAGLVFAVLALSAFMPGFIDRASGRFDAIDAESSEDRRSRATEWIYTRALIAENPILGIGFGEQQFLARMAQTDFHERYGEQSLDNPHNSYLQAAIYAGIPACIAFVLANIALLMRAIVFGSRKTNATSSTAFGLTVGILGFMVCIYPDMQLFTPHVGPLYWLLFGILFSLLSVKAEQPVTQPQPQAPRQVGPVARQPVPVTVQRRRMGS